MKENKTELILLGTGNAMVTKCFNTCFALKNKEGYFLVDAGGGNGILVQLEKAKIDYNKLHQMFVTHGHTDHVLGVIWVIRKIATLMSGDKYEGDFTIYSHNEVIHIIKIICDLLLPKKFMKLIGSRIILEEVKDKEELETNGMQIKFFDIHSTKAKQFGFQAILSDQKRLVCLGDEPCHESCRKYVKGADWLLSEAFCLYEERNIFKPYEKHHSTVVDAAKLAEELNVKNLVLYHTEDTHIEKRKELYTTEAESVFSRKVYVPDDLEIIIL